MSDKKNWKALVKGCYRNNDYWLGNYGVNSKNVKLVVNEIIAHRNALPQKPKLTIILHFNKLGPVGCHSLSKTRLEGLNYINLCNNEVGDIGCMHLSRVKWDTLQNLLLDKNGITYRGCAQLSKGAWPNLIVLKRNEIGKQGFSILRSRNWMINSEYEEEQGQQNAG